VSPWDQAVLVGLVALSTAGCALLFPVLHDDYIEPANQPSETVIVPNAHASAEAVTVEQLPDWSAFQRLTIRRNQITLKTEGDVPSGADGDTP
jgi:hypothetical protein